MSVRADDVNAASAKATPSPSSLQCRVIELIVDEVQNFPSYQLPRHPRSRTGPPAAHRLSRGTFGESLLDGAATWLHPEHRRHDFKDAFTILSRFSQRHHGAFPTSAFTTSHRSKKYYFVVRTERRRDAGRTAAGER